jgi:hypothetical protein
LISWRSGARKGIEVKDERKALAAIADKFTQSASRLL